MSFWSKLKIKSKLMLVFQLDLAFDLHYFVYSSACTVR